MKSFNRWFIEQRPEHTLKDIVKDLLLRSGWGESDIDLSELDKPVGGYVEPKGNAYE